MQLTIPKISQLYATQGHHLYDGEAISQLEHALQCAALAEEAGQSNEMVAACLLHDIGHLLHGLGESAVDRGIDNHHEYRAIPFLKAFGAAVTEPIRLHVQAKRYLCAIDPNYLAELSAASRQSLKLQGGIFSPKEAETFIHRPYAKESVQLRHWDDQAKVVGLATPNLSHFIVKLEYLGSF